jgi:hypothetical protein
VEFIISCQSHNLALASRFCACVIHFEELTAKVGNREFKKKKKKKKPGALSAYLSPAGTYSLDIKNISAQHVSM